MTSINRQDADLHYEDGSHKGTPNTTRGNALAAYEKRIRKHLDMHKQGRMRRIATELVRKHRHDPWDRVLMALVAFRDTGAIYPGIDRHLANFINAADVIVDGETGIDELTELYEYVKQTGPRQSVYAWRKVHE